MGGLWMFHCLRKKVSFHLRVSSVSALMFLVASGCYRRTGSEVSTDGDGQYVDTDTRVRDEDAGCDGCGVASEGDEPCEAADAECGAETGGDGLLAFVDADRDGFGDDGNRVQCNCAIPEGFSDVGGDCDDLDPEIHPGADELCDGVDNNCSGEADEGVINCHDGEIDPMIVAGDLFTCALDRAGKIHCWGYVFTGCAPILTEPCELLAIPEGQFVEISAAGIWPNLCGLRPNGEVECIGDSGTKTGVPSGAFRQVSAGYAHACAIRPDDTVECWSWWHTPPAERFSDLASGEDHTCGLTLDSTLACWGEGTTETTEEQCSRSGDCAQSLPPEGEFVQVTAGWTNTCALRMDGTIACWGSDTDGRSTPPTGSFKRLARTHSYANCAIRDDDSIACWGNGFHLFEADGPFKDVAVGAEHACALTPDNEIVCWGERLGGCEGCDPHLPPEGLTL